MRMPHGWELIVLVLLVFVLFGAKKLPEATRSVAKSFKIFRQEMQSPDDAADKTEAAPAPTMTPPANTTGDGDAGTNPKQ